MKRNIKKIVILSVVLVIAVIFSRCQNDEYFLKNDDTNLASVKTWFSKYEGNGDNLELFQNLNYEWQKAEIKEGKDGTQLIVVPIVEVKKEQNEDWEQRLYIYKIDQNNYKALLYEFYPENLAYANSNDFNGYISVWDLKTGFIKAAKFVNDKIVENGDVEILSKDKLAVKNTTAKVPQESNFDDDTSVTVGGIQLRAVVVQNNYIDSMYYVSRRGTDYMGGSSEDYTSGYGGGGGGSGSNTTALTNAQITKKNINSDKLDLCTKSVLDKLKNLKQSDIADMISKFDSNSSILTINFKTGVVTNSNNDAETVAISNFNYNITLNERYTNGVLEGEINSPPTTLSLATTLTHEIIHAYLLSVVDEYKVLGTSKICDFPTIYDAYITQKIPAGSSQAKVDAQHELIATKYVNSIASSIQEFETGFPVVSGFPNQVYLDIAWAGLEGTYIFNKNYPNDPNHKNYKDRNRILSRGSIEKYNKSRGNQIPVGKPCK